MCGLHWRMLPAALQRLIYQDYRPGQEFDKRPTIEYLCIAAACIAYVHKKEQLSNKEPSCPTKPPSKTLENVASSKQAPSEIEATGKADTT